MLDSFEILSTSGIVLWSKSYAPVSPNIINNLINDIFIEERSLTNAEAANESSSSRCPEYRKDKYTLKWTIAKDFNLIFVAVYQSLLNLTWIDDLVKNVKTIFISVYKDLLKRPKTSVLDCGSNAANPFDPHFDLQVQKLENSAKNQPGKPVTDGTEARISDSLDPGHLLDKPPPLPAILRAQEKGPAENGLESSESTPIPSPDTSRPSSPMPSHLLSAKSGPAGRVSRRGRKAAASPSSYASSGEESSSRTSKAKFEIKKNRRWDADGLADEDDGVCLDYSAAPTSSTVGGIKEVANELTSDPASWGTWTGKGEFLPKELDDNDTAILSSADEKISAELGNTGLVGSSISAIGGLFRNIIGGKVLAKKDLETPMKGMLDLLMKKNVAQEAAVKVCESVERSLIGVKTANFQSVESAIKSALESALTKILTPSSSLDLLREIQTVTNPSALSMRTRRPYVISIVGVNGVGKSTNLSKICYFLLQNKYKVLIAACDTFRSGAVEQLRIHVRRLDEHAKQEGGRVDLFEKGYGKDAANIAKDAVTFAAQGGFDVVLIDTAGRRHNDQRLMSSLEKFAKLAQPDKIFMVGEALVGTDSVQQARNFNAAFGAGRNLDGFIISKCDTVGDMVGTLVSMVYATGIPIVFLGVGQFYTDIRVFSVAWAVKMLMR
ncbi:MAG: hypothetical protein M1829_000295 [Trizodia sp. TS-e1964]|nr:MAG: hypothetical protein M1829_000295 [Trizodia sp. TS-e1964]